jgi:thiosulfate/3-mercaptopyruvate sulfurtransferase
LDRYTRSRKGAVKGNELEATYLWDKDGVIWNTRIEYWFKGTLIVSGQRRQETGCTIRQLNPFDENRAHGMTVSSWSVHPGSCALQHALCATMKGKQYKMEDSPLVSAQYVLDHLEDPQVKFFDVRGVWGDQPGALTEQYMQGHIPHAIYLDWTQELITTTTAIADAPVPDIKNAHQSFQNLGISAEDTVVLYDDYDHLFASRVWWVMRYFGHPGVKILDGGWPNWQAKGYPVSTENHTPEAGDFLPKEQHHLRVDAHEVLNRSNDTILVDGRSVESYTGLAGDARSGHIPGAINIPFKSLLDGHSGLFIDDQSLKQLFSKAGIDSQKATVMSSCGSGYAGSVILVGLKKIGIEAPLYDGSFSEWKKDPDRPVEQI